MRIFTGTNLITCVKSDPIGWGDKMQDIYILPERTTKAIRPLTSEAQSASSSELWKLMRIARIARPGAAYGASVTAQTFAYGGRVLGNPISFGEAIGTNVTSAKGNLKFSHENGSAVFLENKSKDSDKVNLLNKNKKKAVPNTHIEEGIFYLGKSVKIKIGRANYNKISEFPLWK